MSELHERLDLIVTIGEEYAAQEVTPFVEDAGLRVTSVLKRINIITGDIALPGMDETIGNIQAVPGVAAVEKDHENHTI